jgi:hypothetical protein
VVRLARREGDPLYYASFEPLHAGPVGATLALAAIAICGVLIAPFRIVGRLLRLGP